MATATAAKPRRQRSASSLVRRFTEWLGIKDDAAALKIRQEELRLRLLDETFSGGRSGEDGHVYLPLSAPVEFEDHKGKVHKYTALKAERHLVPAVPLPDPEKTEALLRKKGLWLDAAQEKTIRDLQVRLPNVTITVDVDVDAVSGLYFKKVLTEKEYESLLTEQTEQWQLKPTEA